jgi:hypothetical protein
VVSAASMPQGVVVAPVTGLAVSGFNFDGSPEAATVDQSTVAELVEPATQEVIAGDNQKVIGDAGGETIEAPDQGLARGDLFGSSGAQARRLTDVSRCSNLSSDGCSTR